MGPRWLSTGVGIEATALTIDYLFRGWPFRKHYFEGTDFTLGPVKSGLGKYFHREGCLLYHEFLDGRWWDWETFAIYREGNDEIQ